MTNEEIFAAWAPANSVWSRWAKPVLFAHLSASVGLRPSAAPQPDVSWAPSPRESTGLVLELPCEEAVWIGLALAGMGYRPVPLYNAIPIPLGVSIFEAASPRSFAAVNVLPIVTALRQSADGLAKLSLPANAPPAFLLDSHRYGERLRLMPEEFDNRSVCFTTDFPSANFLHAQGIERVLLVQRGQDEPRADLAHVLRRWQDGGLVLARLRVDLPAPAQRFEVRRPPWYGVMFQRALAAFGLRRAPDGGFGNWMPGSPGVG